MQRKSVLVLAVMAVLWAAFFVPGTQAATTDLKTGIDRTYHLPAYNPAGGPSASDSYGRYTVNEILGLIESGDVAGLQTYIEGIVDSYGAGIKSAYEAQADTNALTDALLTKINSIEPSATQDQTGAEITALLNAYLGTTDWQSGGTGGVSELDALNDVTGDGTAGYFLKDDGDGTFSFGPAPTAIDELDQMTDVSATGTVGYVLQDDGDGTYSFRADDTGSGEANVQPDWNEANTGSDAFILNKPTTITTAQADEIAANTLKRSYPVGDESKLDGIEIGAEVNVNADWNSTSGDSQILNKPTLGTAADNAEADFASAAQGATADSALQPSDVDDIPVDGATTAPVSSNRLYDHENGADPHTQYLLESLVSSFAGTLLDDSTAAGARATLGLGPGDTPTFAGVDIPQGVNPQAAQFYEGSADGTNVGIITVEAMSQDNTVTIGDSGIKFNGTLIGGSSIASIDDIPDVDTSTSPPSIGDPLEWDGSNWVPGTDDTAAGAGYVATPWTYSDETCTAGQYALDESYRYDCIASGNINRTALTGWSNPTPAASQTVTYKSTSYGVGDGTTDTVTVTVPTVADGDIIIAHTGSEVAGTVSSTGWTEIGGFTSDTPTHSAYALYKIASSESGSYTFTFSASTSGTYVILTVFEKTGGSWVAPTTAGYYDNAYAEGLTVTAGPIDVPEGAALFAGVSSDGSAAIDASPAGMTMIGSQVLDSTTSGYAFYQEYAASTTSVSKTAEWLGTDMHSLDLVVLHAQ